MFIVTTQIARSPAVVFARLVQIEEAPLWYSAVKTVQRKDTAPVGQGTRARFRRQIGGAMVENEVEVSEFKPNEVFTVSSVSGPTPFQYRYRLAPIGGGTILGLEGEISGDGLGGLLGMFKPLAETFFKRGMSANLAAFKRLVESG